MPHTTDHPDPSIMAEAEGKGWRELLPIKLAIGTQCLAWAFQLPYVPLFCQESLGATKLQV